MSKADLVFLLLCSLTIDSMNGEAEDNTKYGCCSCLRDCCEIVSFHMMEKEYLAGTPTERVQRYLRFTDVPKQLTMKTKKKDP